MRDTFVEDVHQSIIQWGLGFIARKDIQDIAGKEIKYHVWDSYGDINDLPDDVIFGHAGFALDTDGLTGAVNFSYGLSFVQDLSLNRHMKIMSRLLAQLTPEKQIPFIDGDDETETSASWMVVTDETQMLPIVRTPLRPVQFVQVTLEVNPYLLDHTVSETSP